MSAASRLAGKYKESADAVKKLTDQIRSWHDKQDEGTGTSENFREGLNGGGGTPPPSSPPIFSAPQPMGRSSPAQAVAGAVGGILGTVANYGQSKLGPLLAENAMTTQASYMGGTNPQAELAQVVGSGGGGYNNVANNTQDAMQQLSTIQNLTGSAMVNQTSQGRAAFGTSFAAGYLNPGMSGAQASQFASSIYQPATSQYMSQFGISPMQLSNRSGGKPKAAPIGTFADSLLYKMMGGRSVNNKQLANFMKVGGTGQAEFQFLTGGAINEQQMMPIMMATNQLQRSGASEKQTNWALTQAGHGNKNAITFLKKHGVAETDITGMKAANAPNMARTADQYSGMQEGLTAATAAITAFNTQFSKFMKETGLDAPVGMAQGAIGTTNLLEPDLFPRGGAGSGPGGIAGSIGKMLLMRKLFSAGKPFIMDLLKKIPKIGDLFKGAGGDISDLLKKVPGIGDILTKFGGPLKFAGPIGMGISAFLGLGQMMTSKNNPMYQWMNATIGQIPFMKKPLKWAEGLSTKAFQGTERDVVHPVTHAIGSAFHHVTNFLGGLFGGGASGPNTKKGTGQPSNTSGKGSISGASIVNYAKQFIGHPYALGGPGDYQTSRKPPYGPWDCAGFVTQMYAHFGISGWPSVNVGGLTAWGKITNQPVVGGFVTYVTDGSIAAPGHVGLITGPNSTIQAMDAALGTRASNLGSLGHAGSGGPVHYYVPPHGFVGGSAVGGNGGQSAPVNAPVPVSTPSVSSLMQSPGTGDTSSEGSTQESAAFLTAIQGGITGGSGYSGQNLGTYEMVSYGGTNAPGGGGAQAKFTAGSTLANGAAIYDYLLSNLFSGKKIAAAGAIASMWGESTWNPESAGTGGWGLMGWTNNYPDARTGNATKDMNMELPLIIKFVHQMGDMGAISQMMNATSVAQAANIWGPQVERFGINDVHPQGIALATQIMNAGGSQAKGHAEGGDIEVHHAHKTKKITAPEYTYSTLHPVYSGGNDLLPDVPIDLRFKKKSVKFVFPAAANTDTGASHRAQMDKAKTAVNTVKLHTKISKGVK